MIKVKYTVAGARRHLELTGHAGSAPAGQDLVCAGVSVLAYTVTQMVSDLASVMTEPSTIEMSSGRTVVECSPSRDHAEEIDVVFATILCGLRLLSAQYPNYVQVEG